jgi:hypothetical protein
MNRHPIPSKTETKILLNCRRRCCLCFGLEKDHRIKHGQIAHLDHDRSNNNPGNLVFLCLEHHDQYDSKTSQSKKITKNEIIAFLKELECFINENWNRPITDNKHIKIDIFSGVYSKGNDFESSELKITYLGDNLIHINGTSLWGLTREYGPNIGELDFVTEVNINKAVFTDTLHDLTYSLELEFWGDKLVVIEKAMPGYFGMNVSFGGKYNKQLF